MAGSVETPTPPMEDYAAPAPERSHAIGRFLMLSSLGAGGVPS